MSPFFKYHTKDTNGVDRDGTIEASDEMDVMKKLQEQGLFVISIEMAEGREKKSADKPAQVEQHGTTKKCPYCAEEIQDEAILCRFCGKGLKENLPEAKWYFKTSWVITAFLCAGPLALPLLWINPRFSQKTKAIVTIITIILSWYLGSLLINSLKSLKQYYGVILQNNF